MRYYLIAGEASGDLHGANLIKGLLRHDPGAELRFWGGDRMARAGGAANLARHYKTTSFFGFVKVAANIATIVRQLRECKKDLLDFAPDVLILIDYPGFNFRMAEFAHNHGIKTFYYISPKVWAWKESRVKLIRKYVDKLFIIFPFEIEYFLNKGIDTIFEGNPLVDAIEDARKTIPARGEFLENNGIPGDLPLVALLAGSRRSEIKYSLPFMAGLAAKFPGYSFVVAGVSWLDEQNYLPYIPKGGSNSTNLYFIRDQTYALLAHSEAAVVTSGTATLETALLDIPQVVCYSGDKISVAIARRVIKVPFISLVNLIMGREVVRELIQWDMTLENAVAELRSILPGGGKRERMLTDLAELRALVGGPGASDRFAERMVAILKSEEL